jgi:hypothetical protein
MISFQNARPAGIEVRRLSVSRTAETQNGPALVFVVHDLEIPKGGVKGLIGYPAASTNAKEVRGGGKARPRVHLAAAATVGN